MNNRILYFDVLRILACLAVVLLHVSGYIYGTDITNLSHWFANMYDGMSRWGVPIFVMISGAIFLDPKKQITIKDVFCKYIFHIMLLFFIWSIFYALLLEIKNGFNLFVFAKRIIGGHFHLWFLYMLSGLYLIVPILRPITKTQDKKLLFYLLVLWFIFSSLIPLMCQIFPCIEENVNLLINTKLFFYFPFSYLGYFVLGYFLHNFIEIKKYYNLFVLIILLCFVVTIAGNMKYSLPNQTSFFFKNLSPFNVIIASLIFLLVKNKSINIRYHDIIIKLSNLTLGVYLIHPLFLAIIEKLNLYYQINILLNDNNFFTIPIIFILISLLSFITIFIVSKIPFVRKICK